MISKHTKILFLIAGVCIGIALVWHYYSQAMYEKSHHSQILYYLDPRTGVLTTNRPDGVPSLVRALGLVGMFALLFGVPLLVSDITHRRHRRRDN